MCAFYLTPAANGTHGLTVVERCATRGRLCVMVSAVTSKTPRGQVTTRQAILTGWLLCGVLDITAACLQAWIQAGRAPADVLRGVASALWGDRKSTRLNSSHLGISYAVFC